MCAGISSVAWDPADTAVATLSARSGFDLLLGAVDWAPGSEIVFSAVSIPHLAALVRSHGYVPIPIDLDRQTLEVDAAVVDEAWPERTRAVGDCPTIRSTSRSDSF
jgi:perosamine synthetase